MSKKIFFLLMVLFLCGVGASAEAGGADRRSTVGQNGKVPEFIYVGWHKGLNKSEVGLYFRLPEYFVVPKDCDDYAFIKGIHTCTTGETEDEPYSGKFEVGGEKFIMQLSGDFIPFPMPNKPERGIATWCPVEGFRKLKNKKGIDREVKLDGHPALIQGRVNNDKGKGHEMFRYLRRVCFEYKNMYGELFFSLGGYVELPRFCGHMRSVLYGVHYAQQKETEKKFYG